MTVMESNTLFPLLYTQFTILILVIYANAFGIRCLSKQKSSSTNRWVILQNLAVVNILRAAYDTVVLLASHTHTQWYETNASYIAVGETMLMTWFFIALIFISLDKILVLILQEKYKFWVTKRRVEWAIPLGCMFGLISGLLSQDRQYWYIVVESVVISLILGTAVLYGRWIRQRDARFPLINSGRCRRMNTLLLVSFVTFYVVPDVTLMFVISPPVMLTVRFIHTIGYFADSFIYIFTIRSVKKSARRTIASYTGSVISLKKRMKQSRKDLFVGLSTTKSRRTSDDELLADDMDKEVYVDIYEQVNFLTPAPPLERSHTVAFGEHAEIKVDTTMFRKLVSGYY